ncbi:MAG: hypothetical protein CVU63_00135 [Deltaproteobacteria bacterium HGW-Deltaproteobacteria-20]|nr:MAG: hypothetical protein CVU63_00135 [Deltaproteobacteria bacterium HGW-Deltaproteobacteria-20]
MMPAMHDGMRRPLALCVTLVGLTNLSACSALGSCDRSDDGNPDDPYYDGTTVDGSYMSSEWTGPLLPFTGGKRYKLYHGLGCTPRMLECWASFNANGIDDGSIAPPAGNMCVVQDITDKFIVIKNDTCSDMYVLVAAWAPSCEEDAGTSGDGGGS